MNDINKPCGDNVGGIFLFKIAFTDDVQSMSLPINGNVCEPVELKSLARWYDVYGTEGTIKFNEDQQQSPQGDYFKVKLSASIPKDRTEVKNSLEEMKNKTFIIDYTDYNNERKLVGTLTEPLKFSSSLDTGNKIPSLNAHAIEFFGNALTKAPTYSI